MSSMPPATTYHRLLGWHAPALRRAAVMAGIGMLFGLVVAQFVPWGMAAVAGWDAAALTFLAAVWPIIVRADSSHVARLAEREDETRGTATLLLAGASVASLLGAALTLELAGRESGPAQVLLVGIAILTVVLSWTVVNTVFTLRYADLSLGATGAGIDFGDPAGGAPTYRDFAYVAFTIGMTYQVSDTTLRNPRIRRAVLAHALLAYVFGVVIVGGSVNLVAGLIR